MEFIENIKKQEYEDFVSNNEKSHFLQSYEWGVFCKKSKNLTPHYVGLKENNKLIATALLLEKKLPLGYSYFYCPRGFIIDYKNKDLLKEFTNNIKLYLKKYKAIYFRIDPDIPLQKLSIKGDVIDKENNNYDIVNFLKKIGYKHKGFNKNFECSEPRYTFRLNINKSIEEIINGFHPTTKNIIRRKNPFNLIISKNEDDLIEEFYSTMIETGKRVGIATYPLKYYELFYKELHKCNMSDIYTVKADVDELKKIYKEKLKIVQKELDSVKSESKKKEYTNQLNKILKEKKEIDSIEKKQIVLSSMITAKYNDKVWTVHGGNTTALRFLNANYEIYYKIIEDSNRENYKIVDFFGTTGNPDKNNKIYGIHLFKSRLGGEYTEFIGEFDYPIKPLLYLFFIKLIKIKRNIERNKRKNNQ
ncbi:MAG: peptidoglycan bridge formation glycyltransferase FemA/FemB family protein [bacterium]|nr:peptidoglycan bridge formation glycyltransferase FemA/FemB family protein [bacterium]